MSQKLFDDDEKVEKKAKVQEMESDGSLISMPDIGYSIKNPGIDMDERKAGFIAVELILVTYLFLGYAGLVPLF